MYYRFVQQNQKLVFFTSLPNAGAGAKTTAEITPTDNLFYENGQLKCTVGKTTLGVDEVFVDRKIGKVHVKAEDGKVYASGELDRRGTIYFGGFNEFDGKYTNLRINSDSNNCALVDTGEIVAKVRDVEEGKMVRSKTKPAVPPETKKQKLTASLFCDAGKLECIVNGKKLPVTKVVVNEATKKLSVIAGGRRYAAANIADDKRTLTAHGQSLPFWLVRLRGFGKIGGYALDGEDLEDAIDTKTVGQEMVK
ncbi:hypothetical protein FACS189472_08430 [Alphaproteobacteria bacterium]|nr:hypothetical protein FACS189472_08430 [Alphaproteobacteria bacterium]